MWYEKLTDMYNDVKILEIDGMPNKQKGLYIDNIIFIDKNQSTVEKGCILAEELGHHETTYSDIYKQDSIVETKLEIIARRWGYRQVLPVEKLQDALNQNFDNLYEFADYLNVTEDYLYKALEYYRLVNKLSFTMNIDRFL